MFILNPNSLKIGYVILTSTRKFGIEKLQQKAGYGVSSKWTHVAGSLGGLTAIEANIPLEPYSNLKVPFC